MQRIGTPDVSAPTRSGWCEIRFKVKPALTPGWRAALEFALDCRSDGIHINRGGGSHWTIEHDGQLMVLAGQSPDDIAHRLRTVDTILTHTTRLYAQHGRPIDEAAAHRAAHAAHRAQRAAAAARDRARVAQQFTR